MKPILTALGALPLAALATSGSVSNQAVLSGADAGTADDQVAVRTPMGIIIGSVTTVENFNGIPYAEPPVNDLRLRPPKRLSTSIGIIDATGIAPACPQMPANSTEINLPPLAGQDLNIPIWPANETRGQED